MKKFGKLLLTFVILFAVGWYCLYCYEKVDGSRASDTKAELEQVELERDILKYTVSIFPLEARNTVAGAVCKEFSDYKSCDVLRVISANNKISSKEASDPNGTATKSN